jgi:fumarate hydratase subunit alpha
VIDALKKKTSLIKTGAAKIQLKAMLTNVDLARKKRFPMCQDTRILTFFVQLGTAYPNA